MAQLSGIQIGKHARVLAAALALGTAVLSLSAGAPQANAQTVTPRQIYCSIVDRYGNLLHYAPGGIYVDSATGLKWVCGSDTRWYPYGSHLPGPSIPPGGGVLSPTP